MQPLPVSSCCPEPRTPPAPPTSPVPPQAPYPGGFPAEAARGIDPLPCCETACAQWYDPLAHALAHRHAPHPQYHDDLYQEAHIGLLRAYRSFDITRGSFPAFAQQCMFTAVMDFLRSEDVIPVATRRLTRSLLEWFLDTATHRQPFAQEITAVAASTGLSEPKIRLAVLAYRQQPSQEVPEHLPTIEAVEDEIVREDNRHEVLAILASFSARNRMLFLDHLLGVADQKLLAARYGISQPQVSQIIAACWSALLAYS